MSEVEFHIPLEKTWQKMVAAVLLVVVGIGGSYLYARHNIAGAVQDREPILTALENKASREAVEAVPDAGAMTNRDARRVMEGLGAKIISVDGRKTLGGNIVLKVRWQRGEDGTPETIYFRGEWSSTRGWDYTLRETSPSVWEWAIIR